MGTRSESLQRLFHEYQRQNGGVPETPYKVIQWALANGLVAAPQLDPAAVLADEMARALREEYRTDKNGRRYRRNHAARITRNGVQLSLWGEMETAPRDHMVKAFQQRRQQVVGDCFQLKTDVDVYNDRNGDKEPIQVVLNFVDDVAELQAARGDFDADNAAE